jgi:hypothetical protein
LWEARLRTVSRPRPAVPPVVKITLPEREGIVGFVRVVDIVGWGWGWWSVDTSGFLVEVMVLKRSDSTE